MKSVRVIIFFQLLVIGVFLALVGRCFYLQYFKKDYYSSASIKQRQRWIPHSPQRGVILDCRGRVLAASNKVQIVKVEPRKIDDPKDMSSKLQPILNMGAHEICERIYNSNNPGYAKIKVDAEPNECAAACRISSAVGVETQWQRHYPLGRLAAHITGFTSTDNRGLCGLELEYDKKLRGSAAQDIFFADARRRPIRPKEQNGILTDGVGIILTIDATIQQFATEELAKQYQAYRAESATAIVAVPKTGAILAMVSLPDFDPDEFQSANPDTFRNRAITDQFEPGSIIKPIVAAIALDAEVVNCQEKIFCENGSYHGKGFGRIGEYRHGFGDLTLREILVESSNIGMAKIGQRLGKERLYKGLKLFGFGQKTGIDLPGEVEGLVWPLSKWTGYSITRVPFGQEISITSMQLVRAFCILANGGHLVRPYLVRAIVGNNGEIIKLQQPTPGIGYIIRPEVAKWIVSDAMVGVINEGTGKRAKLDGWQLFGKTGTANIAKSNERGYSESDYVASFIAGAPIEDPAVVVLVSIRKPDKGLGKGYTGGAVAAPVAAKIIEKTLSYLGVPKKTEQMIALGRSFPR